MLTPEQKLSICEILNITPIDLDAQIAYLGVKLTTEIETAIVVKITEWNGGAGSVFTSFTPTESNKGFNLNADAPKNQIRSAIAVWLERPDWKSIAGIGRLTRS